MKKIIVSVVCVAFASASAFAGSCCGDKEKDGNKDKGSKETLTS